MNIDKYKHDDWIVYFSGDKWPPLGFTSWITLFTHKPFSVELDYFVNQAIMVWDGETTTCYIRESERKHFGDKVVKEITNNPDYVDDICKNFYSGTDIILSIYDKQQKEFTYKEYADYNASFLKNYYPYHIQVKNVVDFLPKNLLNTHLPKLEAARVNAEPVFSKEIDYMKRIAEYISKKTGHKTKHILHSFVDELSAYWKDGKNLPDENILKERCKNSVIFFENGKIQNVLIGKDISQFASIFSNKDIGDTIEGQTAFGGKAEGVARIITNLSIPYEFNDGDILVAPWTRPEYLPIMKKAGAFITDGGGILSHAAIVARELKKPCVIATKNATQILKNGDMIKVDADRGTVKKINN